MKYKNYVVGDTYTGKIIGFAQGKVPVSVTPMTLKQAKKFTGKRYVILEVSIVEENDENNR